MVPEEETDPQSEEEVEILDHHLLEAGHLLRNDELLTGGHHQERKEGILVVEIVIGLMTDVTMTDVIILIEEMIEEEGLTIEEMIGETNETLFEEATITIDLIATVEKVVSVVVEEITSVTMVEMTDSMTDEEEEEVTTIEEAVTVVTTVTAKPTDPDFPY